MNEFQDLVQFSVYNKLFDITSINYRVSAMTLTVQVTHSNFFVLCCTQVTM